MTAAARQVALEMPEIDSKIRQGDLVPFPNPLRVGWCEGVVTAVYRENGVWAVEFEINVDGLYFAKMRATISGTEVLWSPVRTEGAAK